MSTTSPINPRDFIARSADPDRGIKVQYYHQHVPAVIWRAEKNALACVDGTKHSDSPFVSTVKLASMLHDLGKLYPKNQDDFRKDVHPLTMRHEAAGTLVCGSHSTVAALLTAAHHANLPTIDKDTFQPFDDKLLLHKNAVGAADLVQVHEEIMDASGLSALGRGSIASAASNIGAWSRNPTPLDMRMMLSCLVDADHGDAAQWSRSERRYLEPPAPRWAERIAQLDAHVASLPREWKNEYQKERQRLRDLNYQLCKNADTKLGIRSCDAPVGTGKTFAYMRHALQVALDNNLRHILVVLPLTAIIDQVGDVLQNVLLLPDERREPEMSVAMVHHALEFSHWWLRKYSDTFQAPITITTSVNFFESLAGRSTSALRKLHQFSRSVIVIDESHLALHMCQWRLPWQWLQQLVEDYRCHVVLSSGTQIPFWLKDDPLALSTFRTPRARGFVHRTAPVVPLVDEHEADQLRSIELRRVSIVPASVPVDYQGIIREILQDAGPTCVVVNTIRNAAYLAFLLSQSTTLTVLHISTALTPHDRAQQMERMRQLQRDGCDFITVGTSCIETGLDVSFARGFRQRAGMWNVLQLSGRVNRNFEYGEMAPIYEFILNDPESSNNPFIGADIRATERLLDQGGDLTIEHCQLFLDILQRETINRASRHGLLATHVGLWEAERQYRFETVADFHVIEARERTLIVDADVVNDIQDGKKVKPSRIVRHSVRVDLDRLDKFGISYQQLYPDQDAPNPFLNALYVLDPTAYNPQYGYMASVVDAFVALRA